LRAIPLSAGGTDYLELASLSDVGCVRQNNEDSLGVFPGDDPAKGTLILVADGMGGAAAGEVASRLAVDTVSERYFHAPDVPPSEALRAALESANSAILSRAASDPRLSGMGTTCTAVVLVGRELWCGHVGDSRAYLAVDGGLRQITRDHTLAAEFERQGGEGQAPARARNVLTRCLGVRPSVTVDVAEEAVVLPDEAVLVLCSDGLCNLVEDGELLQIVTMHPPDAACRRLVRLAKERGAPDNVTVAIGRILGD